MSHRRIALVVGFFIILTSVLIVISLVYVVQKKGVFEARIQYKLISENAEDIEEGMPILFSGFEIGQVDELSLNESGDVVVLVSIPKHNTKWVRSGSIFTLERPLIGKPKIILSSSMQSPPLIEGSVHQMQIKDGINEIITDLQPVTSQLNNIVTNVNLLTASLSDQNGSFQSTLDNTQKFSLKLSSSPNLLHTLTGEKRSAKIFHNAISNLDASLQELNKLIQNTDEGIHEIRTDVIKPLNTDLKELEYILQDIRNKLKEINNTVTVIGQSDKDIVYLKDEMKVRLEEINELTSRINSIIGKEQKDKIELP